MNTKLATNDSLEKRTTKTTTKVPSVYYHGNNTTDLTVTFSIGPDRYEYFLPNPLTLEAVEFIARRWPRKGLNLAKSRATRTEKLQ